MRVPQPNRWSVRSLILFIEVMQSETTTSVLKHVAYPSQFVFDFRVESFTPFTSA